MAENEAGSDFPTVSLEVPIPPNPDAPIALQVDLEELHALYVGLLPISRELGSDPRLAKVAKDMMDIFLPVLIECGHPYYVRVGDAESDESGPAGEDD